ncbi:phosphatidate cytidylyltransferase [Granulicatella sp. zg-84]|nr:phosphatidate cytidylyltransferase [Granulicatella sp. zg-84]
MRKSVRNISKTASTFWRIVGGNVLKLRIITALVILAIGLPLLYFGGLTFQLSIVGLATICFMEIMHMAKIKIPSPEVIIGLLATIGLTIPITYYNYFRMTPLLWLCLCSFALLVLTVFSKNEFSFEKVGIVSLAALYIGLGAHHVLILREYGFVAILFIFSIGWITDSGAYFVGRRFGKHRLAPHISPNKSIEGSVGGTALAVLYALIFVAIHQPFATLSLDFLGTILLAFGVSLAGQMGDLVESALKRFYHVKDSGNILPGHGGVLDRFDSTLFGVVACHIILICLI